MLTPPHFCQNHLIPLTFPQGIQQHLKRTDLIHPSISGNKYYKLQYNQIEAKAQGLTTLLTFGGAYSNHIATSVGWAEAHPTY